MGQLHNSYIFISTQIVTALAVSVADAATCTMPIDCLSSSSSCQLFTHHFSCIDQKCSCRTGGKPITSSDSKYTLHVTRLTYADADAVCRKAGQRLVKIDSDAKMQDVKQFAIPAFRHMYLFTFATYGAWIGLRHDSSVPGRVYRYSDGQEATYLKWEHNEPNHVATDNCIRASIDHFLMRTGDCDGHHPFICETISTPVTSPTTSSGEECISKGDCQFRCSTSEYHCVEYKCKCGSLPFV